MQIGSFYNESLNLVIIWNSISNGLCHQWHKVGPLPSSKSKCWEYQTSMWTIKNVVLLLLFFILGKKKRKNFVAANFILDPKALLKERSCFTPHVEGGGHLLGLTMNAHNLTNIFLLPPYFRYFNFLLKNHIWKRWCLLIIVNIFCIKSWNWLCHSLLTANYTFSIDYAANSPCFSR